MGRAASRSPRGAPNALSRPPRSTTDRDSDQVLRRSRRPATLRRGAWAALAVVAAAMAFAAPAAAAVLVSNYDQANALLAIDLGDWDVATSFTTGSNATGYTLTSVEMDFKVAPDSTVAVKVLLGSRTGSVHATLTNPSSLAAGKLTFTAPARTRLAASTTYTVTIAAASGEVWRTSSTAEDAGGATGWSIADRHFTYSGATLQDFTGAKRMRINGTVNPPVLVSNIGQAATSTFTLNQQAWAHSFKTGPNVTGYALPSIDVKFGAAPNSTVRVRLLEGDHGGSLHANLTNPSSLAAGDLTFTAPAGTTLAASTRYTIVVDSATSGTLSLASTDTIDAGGARGWGIGDSGHECASPCSSTTPSWSAKASEMLFRVNGTANPPVLVANIDQTASGTQALNNFTVAQAFTTGASATGYALNSIDVKFGTAPNSTVRVRVSTTDATGGPDATFATLTNPSSLAAGNLTFTATAGTTLAAGTTYAVLVDSATSGTVSRTNTDTIDTGAAPGWSMATNSHQAPAGGSFSTNASELLIRVNGTVNAPVLLSNIEQMSHFTEASLSGSAVASLFTTGAKSTGYTLAGMALKFFSAPNASVRVRILDVVDVSGFDRPGTTTIALLTNPSSLAAGNLRFTAPEGTTLAAGTSYAVVVDSATSGALSFTLATMGSEWAIDPGGEPDWSILGLQSGGTGSWVGRAGTAQFRITGTPNPVTLVSNTGQALDSGDSVGISGMTNHELAVAFTTGPSEEGYTLSEVGVRLATVAPDASPKVSVYTTDDSGNPDSPLHVLTNPDTVANGDRTFTAAAGATLAANTTYAVVFQETGTSGNYQVWGTTGADEDSGGACGWSVADKLVFRDAAAATPAWTEGARTTWIGIKGRAADTTPPVLVSALVIGDHVIGDKLTLIFNECLGAAASLANSAFAVKKAGPGDTEIDVALSTSTAPAVSGKEVVLTLASAIGSTDRGFKVSYTKPDSGTGNRIVNEAGLDASFSDQAAARTLVSNARQPATSSIDTLRDRAQPFTTGGNGAGYTLTAAAFRLQHAAAAVPTYTVSVHSDSSSSPGASLGTLTKPASLPTSKFNNALFTAAGDGIDLAADTTYWLVWDYSAGSSAASFLFAGSGEDPGRAAGWMIGNTYRAKSVGGTSWGSPQSTTMKIAIYGHIIPQPMATGVQISSTPTNDEDGDFTPETYALAAKIQVQVTFDRTVNVVTTGGTPRLKIRMEATSGEKWASYEGGTGTKVLTFGYAVVAADRSTGVAVLENTLELNGGTMKDADDATVDASLAHTGLAHDSGHKVDGSLAPDETAPVFASAAVNGTTLTVAFNEGLDPASAPAGSAFAVSGGRAGTGTARISGMVATVTLDTAVPHGEQMLTVSYTSPGAGNSPLRDGSGNEVADFSGQPVTNNTPDPNPPPPPGGGGGGGQPPRPDPPPPPNRAPETAEEIGDLMLRVGAELQFDLADAFDDPDDDELEYTAESSDSGVAAVELDGAALTVRATGPGEAEIAATAEDPDGKTARQTFDVTVRWPETVWYLPAAADPLRQGFVRVINHSDAAGEATVAPTDDAGFAYEPLVLELSARQVRHFNSDDLELGNPDKGLAGATGPGTGGWRLVVESDEIDVEALAYARAADGFLTAMNDVVPREDGALRVPLFNPGSNVDQTSLLRLVNPSEEDAEATVTGVDDAGLSPGAPVLLELPAGSACTVDAAQLESGTGLACGSPQEGLGDGMGKWRLAVASEAPLIAMSLLSGPQGHLTNLSGRAAEDDEGVWHVDLFPAASDPLGRQGFVRVANGSNVDGRVTILAYDDSSTRYETLRLALGAGQAAHFNSDDLELGNRAKGLAGSTGAGRGTWRLRMYSGLDIEVNAYVRTLDGFLTAMQARAPAARPGRRVAILNPGSNLNSVGVLRLVNRSSGDAEVAIDGTDDLGLRPGQTVQVLVPATDAVELTAAELESGEHDAIVSGALGDGAGKWRLRVASNRVNTVLSLLSSPGGHLTNLSGADAERELGELPAALLPAPERVTLESPARRELRGRWSAVEGARYDVELVRDGRADEDRSLTRARNTTTSFRWTHLLPGTYSIRARSVNEDRLGGPWRTSEEVEID